MTKHDNVSLGGIMKATEFVKKKGYKTAKLIVDCWCDYPETDVYLPDMMEYTFIAIAPTENCPFVSLCDLKRLVESHEILGLFKSLDQAKADVAACEYAGHADLLVKLDCGIGYINTARVKQAIADVEACHEVN